LVADGRGEGLSAALNFLDDFLEISSERAAQRAGKAAHFG
jgi:hypothetical protein